MRPKVSAADWRRESRRSAEAPRLINVIPAFSAALFFVSNIDRRSKLVADRRVDG